jgi:hypothetical protein
MSAVASGAGWALVLPQQRKKYEKKFVFRAMDTTRARGCEEDVTIELAFLHGGMHAFNETYVTLWCRY